MKYYRQTQEPKKPRAGEAEHLFWVAEAMSRLEFDIAHDIHRHNRIPTAWHDLAKPGRRPKKKVTLSLEEDVIKFFKGLGPGYHARMNDVLKAFVHAKLGRLLNGQDTPEGYVDRVPTFRAEWGDFTPERTNELLGIKRDKRF